MVTNCRTWSINRCNDGLLPSVQTSLTSILPCEPHGETDSPDSHHCAHSTDEETEAHRGGGLPMVT